MHAEVSCKYGVKANMIAIQRVRPECDVIYSDKVGAVCEMIHHGLERMQRVARRQGGVRGGLDANHAAALCAGEQYVVRHHPGRIPHRSRASVRDEDRLAGHLERVQAGTVAGVRDVDGEAELVHPLDGPAAEGGQAAVARLFQPRAERIGFRVGDADLPDPEAVQDVEPVDLVLDRGRRLQAEDNREAAGLLRSLISAPRGWSNEVLMRQVA